MNRPDGSVIIDTKIRTDGMKGGAADIKRQFSDIAGTARQASQEIQLAMSGGFSKSIELAKAKLRSLEVEIEHAEAQRVAARNAGDAGGEERAAAKIAVLYDRIETAREKLQIEVAEAARKQADAEEKAAEKTRKASEKTQRAQENQSKTVQKTGRSMANLEKSTGRFGRRLSSIVSGALFFNVISSALTSMARTMWGAISSTTQMKTALSNLKGAAATAAAPIVNALSTAFAWLANAIASAFAWLSRFYSLLTGKSLDSMKQSAKQLNNMAAGAAKVQKSMAGFDELNVLQDKSSGGSGASSPNYDFGLDVEVDPSIVKAVEDFKAALQPLKDIDFTKTKNSLKKLGEECKNLGTTITGTLGTAYKTVLLPLSQWVIEDYGPESVNTLSEAIGLLSENVKVLSEGFGAFFTETKPIFDFLGSIGTETMASLGRTFGDLRRTIAENGGKITEAFKNIGTVFKQVYSFLEPLFSLLKELWIDAMDGIGQFTDTNLKGIIESFNGLSEFLAGVFTGDWTRAINGLKQAFEGWFTSIKTNLNNILRVLGNAINKIIDTINGLSFTLPNFPGLGEWAGKTVIPNLPHVNVPQLASGAVIPPNAPFLAMLGDQRHGTNIEAPLATIQDAFRSEVGEMAGGMMAGFQASLDVQEQILAAILGIEIGDTTIGEAAARYAATQRMIRGG